MLNKLYSQQLRSEHSSAVLGCEDDFRYGEVEAPPAPRVRTNFIDVYAENKKYTAKKERARRIEKTRDLCVRAADFSSASYNCFYKKQISNNSHESALDITKRPRSWQPYRRRPRAKRALKAFWQNGIERACGERSVVNETWEYHFTESASGNYASNVSAVHHRLSEYFRRRQVSVEMVRLLGAKHGHHHLILRVPPNTALQSAEALWPHGDAALSRVTVHPLKRCLQLINATKNHVLTGRGRLYDVSRRVLSKTRRQSMRWAVLPAWLRERTREGTVLTRWKGGGWVNQFGEFFPSPWKRRVWRREDGKGWAEAFVPV